MNALITVWAKELTDLFRDRRTMMVSLLMGPLLMPALILGIGKLASDRVTTQLEKPLEVPVIGAANAPNLVAWLEGQNIVVKTAPADADEAIRSQREDVILRIGAKFGEQWRGSMPATIEILHDSSREDAQIPVERLRNLLGNYDQGVGALRLVARGISPTVSRPLRISDRDLATPEARRGQALAFLPYLLILTSFLGGAYLVIDATAGERERNSLEPLLATPAKRAVIMSGKIMAACTFGLISLVLTLAMFKLSFQFAPSLGIKLDVSFWALARILLVLLPIVLIGTCLLTLIAAGAKSVKEAQSYMSVLMLVPMLPTIILMVNPVKNQLWMMTVPFLAQNQMILKLVRSETISGAEWGAYLLAGFGAGVVLWWLAARRYLDERLAISA
ncbi:MAG: ABC transporter permease [Arenimonas sp.]|nr:ABC transporter permease [Arenimonas sp.]